MSATINDHYAALNDRFDRRAAELFAAGWRSCGTEYGAMFKKGDQRNRSGILVHCVSASAVLYAGPMEWEHIKQRNGVA